MPIAENTTEREVVNTRILNAAPEEVFQASSDPKLLTQWWGPNGFTSSFHKFEFEAGGQWDFILHGPNGADYPNRIEFVEDSPGKIVLNHISHPKFQATVTYEGIGGKTKPTFRQLFESVADYKKVIAFVLKANERTSTAWKRSWQNLNNTTINTLRRKAYGSQANIRTGTTTPTGIRSAPRTQTAPGARLVHAKLLSRDF